MSRTKIDYGIDLGTTNSALARMENGEPVIKKTETLKDTLPSAIMFTKKQTIYVGDRAFGQLDKDRRTAFKDINHKINTFIEFKRTMGSTKTYYSENTGSNFNSEALSSEIVKTLISFVKDEQVNAAVITVPAKFTVNQKEATVDAAKLAGIKHVELITEPVAACYAYGLSTSNASGYWLVFDFGGGTFDAALVKVEEGILTVLDTEGDNYLGGKNLDYAVVDEFLIPYFENNYSIDEILEDRKNAFRDAWKAKAEEAKISLSFKDKAELFTDLGEDYGEDDEGEAFELEVEFSRSQYDAIARPIFQKAIDICKDLLKRNNLSGQNLDSLILVGGPTFTPLLRQMLREQISPKVDTSVDPMTAVAKGAALYASTVSIDNVIREQTRDKSKLQLDIGYEATSVQDTEFVTIKLVKDKSTQIPNGKLYAVLVRGDGAWSSGKLEINELGELFEADLVAGKPNSFTVEVYDAQGNRIASEPSQLTILQGIQPGQTGVTLPYHIGIEIYDDISEKDVFIPIKGLEKNAVTPATGAINNLRTPKDLRPGMKSDYFDIPIYQGDYTADGTRAIYNHFVVTVRVSGADLPTLLPENSEVEMTLKVNRSEEMTFSAYFPNLDFTHEYKIKLDRQVEPETGMLTKEIRSAKKTLQELDNVSQTEKDLIGKELTSLENQLKNSEEDFDGKLQVLEGLRKQQRTIDNFEKKSEWPKLESKIKEQFYSLEKLIQRIKDQSDDEELDMNKLESHVNELREKVERALKAKDVRLGKQVLRETAQMEFDLRDVLAGAMMEIAFLTRFENEFNQIAWTDAAKARSLIQKGLQMAASNPNKEALRRVVIEVMNLMPQEEQNKLRKG